MRAENAEREENDFGFYAKANNFHSQQNAFAFALHEHMLGQNGVFECEKLCGQNLNHFSINHFVKQIIQL